MKLKKLIGVLTILTLMLLHIKAQSDTALTISMIEAQNYAIANFFASKNAELDIKAAQKKIWETTAIGLPQVSTNGNYQYYIDDVPAAMPFPIFDDNGNFLGNQSVEFFQKQNLSYGASVNQLIFSGEYIVGLQASKIFKLLSEENYEKVKIDLKETVAGTYYTILILAENKRVITETLDNLYINFEHSKKTLEVGLIEDIEVDQLELTIKRTENDLSSIDNQLETMNRMLKYQMGLSANAILSLTDNLPNLLTQNIISDSLYNFVLEENIDYKMLHTQENLQQLSLNREKTLLLPTINGFYNYADVTHATAFTPPKSMVGLSANWTIFQSGMRSAKIAQAKIALEQAQNVKEQESQRLILIAQQSKFDYQTALDKYFNEDANYALSKRVFKKTTARYAEGFVSSLDLSIVNNQYLGAQFSYALAIQGLLSAKIALDKAFNQL